MKSKARVKVHAVSFQGMFDAKVQETLVNEALCLLQEDGEYEVTSMTSKGHAQLLYTVLSTWKQSNLKKK